VQTAFVELQQRWDRVERPGAYLRRVVVSRAKDLHRRRFRERSYPEAAVTEIPEIDETWRELLKLPAVQRDSGGAPLLRGRVAGGDRRAVGPLTSNRSFRPAPSRRAAQEDSAVNTIDFEPVDAELEAHLRRTLTAVAVAAPPRSAHESRVPRRFLSVAVGVAAVLALALLLVRPEDRSERRVNGRSGSWGEMSPGVTWTDLGAAFDLWVDGYQVDAEVFGATGDRGSTPSGACCTSRRGTRRR
jgi:hypothetical protein